MQQPFDSNLTLRFLSTLLLFQAACLAPRAESIHCDDLLPHQEATFDDLKLLILQEDGNNKGCSAASCHGTDDAAHGYRFDNDARIYDALTLNMGPVYAQIASNEMPPGEDRQQWTSDDLRLLRTWYCNGAFR